MDGGRLLTQQNTSSKLGGAMHSAPDRVWCGPTLRAQDGQELPPSSTDIIFHWLTDAQAQRSGDVTKIHFLSNLQTE